MVELQLLNYILNTGDYKVVTENAISGEMFTKYENVFNFIANHYSQYQVVPDKLTIADHFDDFDFIEVAESVNYLVSKIYEEHQFRVGAPKLQAAFETYKQDSNKGIDELKKVLPSLTIQPLVTTNSLIHNAQKRLNRYRERAMNPLRNYITTGFLEIDKATGGWDREEDYVILFARPGKGKSWVAVKCAAGAAQAGFKVLYYSGEIGDDMLGYRLDTSIFNISNYKLTHSDVSIMADYEKAIEGIDKIKGDVIVVTPVELGGLLTVSKLRALIERHTPDIVFVDQISLMNDERKGKSEQEKTSNISKDLKTLQAEKRLPIIAVSQQNREDAEHGAGTENIANSDRLGQDATMVISIDRKDPDQLILKIVKSRFSTSGEKFTYHWKIDKGEFEYVPTEGSSSENTYQPSSQSTEERQYAENRRQERRQETTDLRNQFKDRRRDVF